MQYIKIINKLFFKKFHSFDTYEGVEFKKKNGGLNDGLRRMIFRYSGS